MRIKALLLSAVLGGAALLATPRADAQWRRHPRPAVSFRFDVGYRPHVFYQPHYRPRASYFGSGSTCYQGYGYSYGSRYRRPRDRWIAGFYDGSCGRFVPGHWEYYR